MQQAGFTTSLPVGGSHQLPVPTILLTHAITHGNSSTQSEPTKAPLSTHTLNKEQTNRKITGSRSY